MFRKYLLIWKHFSKHVPEIKHQYVDGFRNQRRRNRKS